MGGAPSNTCCSLRRGRTMQVRKKWFRWFEIITVIMWVWRLIKRSNKVFKLATLLDCESWSWFLVFWGRIFSAPLRACVPWWMALPYVGWGPIIAVNTEGGALRRTICQSSISKHSAVQLNHKFLCVGRTLIAVSTTHVCSPATAPNSGVRSFHREFITHLSILTH